MRFCSVSGDLLEVMLILFLLGLREGMFRSAIVLPRSRPRVGRCYACRCKEHLLRPEAGSCIGDDRQDRHHAGHSPRHAHHVDAMVIPEFHDEKQVVRLVGYEAELGCGPWDMAKGREPAADNEVVLDHVADRHGFSLGRDSFEISGRGLTVVGLSNETASFSGSYVFVRKTFVEALAIEPGAGDLVCQSVTRDDHRRPSDGAWGRYEA